MNLKFTQKYELILLYGNNLSKGDIEEAVDKIFSFIKENSWKNECLKFNLDQQQLEYKIKSSYGTKEWISSAYFFQIIFRIETHRVHIIKERLNIEKIKPIRSLIKKINDNDQIIHEIK